MLFQTPTLSLRVKKADIPRIHIVVTRNIVSKATKRNLVKRRLRNSIKKALNKPLNNVTLFFYTKKGIESQSYKEIEKTVQSLVNAAKL